MELLIIIRLIMILIKEELLAIIKGINKFEVFLLPKPFIIETNNTQVVGFIRNNTGK